LIDEDMTLRDFCRYSKNNHIVVKEYKGVIFEIGGG
jgi:hypothetical protein